MNKRKFNENRKGTGRKGMNFMAAAVLSAALLSGQAVYPVMAEQGALEVSSLLPDNVTIDSPTELSNVSLPSSSYGTLSWADGSYVPSKRVQSCEVVFKPSGSVDLSGVSGWDSSAGVLTGYVTVVVSSISSEDSSGDGEDWEAEDGQDWEGSEDGEAWEGEDSQEWEGSEDGEDKENQDSGESSGSDEDAQSGGDTDQNTEDKEPEASVTPTVTEGAQPSGGAGQNKDDSSDQDSGDTTDKDTDGNADGDTTDKDIDGNASGDTTDKDTDGNADSDTTDKDTDGNDSGDTADQDTDGKDGSGNASDDKNTDDKDSTVKDDPDKNTDGKSEDDVTATETPSEDTLDIFERPADIEDVRPTEVTDGLSEEQMAALAAENHSCNGIYVSGINLPWYVQFRATSGEEYQFANEEDAAIFQSYEFELWDLKNDTEYLIPDGEYISVTVPVKEGYEYIIEHLLDNGAKETIVPSVEGDTMVFSTHSFSPFGIAGSKPVVGSEIVQNGYLTPTPTPAAASSNGSGNTATATPVVTSSTSVSDGSSTDADDTSSSGSTDTEDTDEDGETGEAVNTGDNTTIAPFIILVIAAVVVVGVVLYLKKKKK